jgi:hypothetical protein
MCGAYYRRSDKQRIADLLLLLDMTAITRSSIANVLENLPEGFPAIEDWLT